MELEQPPKATDIYKENFTIDGKEYTFNEIHVDEDIENEKGTLEYILYSLLEKAIDGIPIDLARLSHSAGIPNLMIESTEERARRYLVDNDKYGFTLHGLWLIV